MSIDHLYRKPIENLAQFCFDDKVAEIFDDMALRSIPLYKELMEYCSRISEKYYQTNSKIYDLGCSTGNTIIAVHQKLKNASIIGVDYSEPMLKICSEKLQKLNISAELICSDLAAVELKKTSIIFLNYVLQFTSLKTRKIILEKAYHSLLPGGVLVLSEKITCEDSILDKLVLDAYYDLKRKLGYSDLEIMQKRQALENFLKPISLADNYQILKSVGFTKIEILQKLHSFCTLLVIK